MHSEPKNLLGANRQAISINLFAIQRRNVSHHYLRPPQPRSHKRRLFEQRRGAGASFAARRGKLLADNEFFELCKQPERDPSEVYSKFLRK